LTTAGYYEVVGLVRKAPPEAEAIPGVSYVTGDVKDAATLSPDAFAGCRYVVHLAGIIVEVHGKGQTFAAIHADGTRNVLTAPVPLPFVPVPGSGRNRFQPVDVEDLTACIVRSLTEPAARDQTFEIGGADVVTLGEMIEAFERQIGVKKSLLHMPMPVMFAVAS